MNEGDVAKPTYRTVLLSLATGLALVSGAGSAVAAPAGPPGLPGAPVLPGLPGASPQRYPGTLTRPILSRSEAAPYTARAYLDHSGPIAAAVVDPWAPRPVRLPRKGPDLVVGGSVSSIQSAVNTATLKGGTDRVYIKVRPGTYTGTVMVPAAAPPITLYGGGARPEDVSLELSLDATMSPADYAARVNPAGQYAEGDPAWSMYQSCAGKTTATVGGCAAVLWSQSADFQLTNLTVRNTLLETVDSGTHQAVAVRTDGDRTLLDAVRLISRQDTLYLTSLDIARIARAVVRNSYVEGDTDFVYGRASVVFERDRFQVVSSRKPANGVLFAPATDPAWPFGFLVTDSLITADAGYLAAPTAHLGRAWDAGAGTTGYLPGSSPNGQLLIRDSLIGPGFDVVAPWAPAATTSRPFTTSIAPGRDLNDPANNRLWEFANVGPGA